MVVEQVTPQGMHVGYTDTVSDLLAGLLGSLVAGALALWWARDHRAPGGWDRGEARERRV